MTSAESTTVPNRPLVRLGTRGSALAVRQTARIAEWLVASGRTGPVENRIIRTRGDEETVASLAGIGGSGVFTEAIEKALREGGIDAAVHSLKDLPIDDRPFLRLGAICFREDARDVLVTRDGRPLAALAAGSGVGTSSPRRVAQLKQLRPDLIARPIRGNVETRIAKVDSGDFDAVILAAAGLHRLGHASRIAQSFDLEEFTPAPGQGALAVQCRANDEALLDILSFLDDVAVRACTVAERAFLAGLGGGCSLPVGAYATVEEGPLRLIGFVGAVEGGGAIRVHGAAVVEDAPALGHRLAREAIDAGALDLIA
jgi:hydroxymethylbilane synthase